MILPRQLDGVWQVPCDRCGRPMPPETAHIVHEKGCRFEGGFCRCDTGQWTCLECCDECGLSPARSTPRQWAVVLALSIALVLITLAAVLIVRATNDPPSRASQKANQPEGQT